MGVSVERDPVRAQRSHLLDGARQRIRRLQRQAVDQVGVDRFEADLARGLHQLRNLLVRLDAMHGLLDERVEVLHAEAQTVEAERCQMREPLPAHGARVDLDRNFGSLQKGECASQRAHHAVEFGVRQEGRRSAAEVKLQQGLAAAERFDLQCEFVLERIEILAGALVMAGDDLVARTVIANRLAKRNVHVDRQRRAPANGAGRLALRQRLAILLRAEGLDEAVGGRIGGVAWTAQVEAAQQRIARCPGCTGFRAR